MIPADLSHFGFFVLPDYSMIAVTNAIEACRMANRCMGRDVYSWSVLGLDGEPVTASNGMTMAPMAALESVKPDIVFVCGGVDVRSKVGKPHLAALRRLARRSKNLGALCTGTFALAEAGLLNGYRCAVHWEDSAAIRAEFPAVKLVNELFVLDRDRLTCTGGIGPLDMVLFLIEKKLGRRIAEQVSLTFILDRIRDSGERQPVNEHDRLVPDQKTLRRAITLIDAQLSDPQPMHEIAAQLGISLRQLERLFRKHLDESPGAYAQKRRLKQAQAMLREKKLPVTNIALSCGFSSSAYFSAAYRSHFGYSPRMEQHVSARSRA
jgi:transcriptional regulator GlxA family with amidase domain